MIIEVCQNLLVSIKKLRFKHWNEELINNEIFLKIKKTLLVDKIINYDEEIEFKIVNYKCQCVIIHELKKVIHFCQMLSKNDNPRSRNTFLSQNVLHSCDLAEKLNYDICVSLNPYDLDNKKLITALFITITIRELLTIHISINNSLSNRLNQLQQLQPFTNINDFLTTRQTSRNKNKRNMSTIVDIDNLFNQIIVYGRLDGANASDTILVCKTIRVLANENVSKKFYNVTPDNKQSSYSSIERIKKTGFTYIDMDKNLLCLIENIKNNSNDKNILRRMQPTFKANIIKKYSEDKKFNIHKCMCCNYSIESNLIASHIHRYADIIEEFNNHKIDAKTAVHLIVSGDNGFLLCPNQDKEFEKGQIYFDINKKKFVANKKKLSNPYSFEQISNNLKYQSFENIKLTEEFNSNIEKHHKRVGI